MSRSGSAGTPAARRLRQPTLLRETGPSWAASSPSTTANGSGTTWRRGEWSSTWPVLLSLRVGELAVHTWDVVVALDPSATVAPDSVELLVGTLDRVAGRGKPDGTKRRLHVVTTGPERHFTLETGDAVKLAAFEPDDYDAELQLPAEAFLRLVYGRLDPAHTPPVEARGVDLDELRAVFPGF